MTNDYRLTHSRLAHRAGWPAVSRYTEALYRDGKDSSLKSLALLRAGASLGMTSPVGPNERCGARRDAGRPACYWIRRPTPNAYKEKRSPLG
jgi:hypothetical protein